MKPILAALDLSGVTDAVVSQAAQLAAAFGSPLTLLTVLVPPVFLESYAPPPKSLARVLTSNEKAASARLAELRDSIRARGVTASVEIVTGHPARAIADRAATLGASHLVIGTHGHGAFYDLVVGSTTHSVLKLAPCPVLVVPARLAPRRRRSAAARLRA